MQPFSIKNETLFPTIDNKYEINAPKNQVSGTAQQQFRKNARLIDEIRHYE